MQVEADRGGGGEIAGGRLQHIGPRGGDAIAYKGVGEADGGVAEGLRKGLHAPTRGAAGVGGWGWVRLSGSRERAHRRHGLALLLARPPAKTKDKKEEVAARVGRAQEGLRPAPF